MHIQAIAKLQIINEHLLLLTLNSELLSPIEVETYPIVLQGRAVDFVIAI